MKDHLDCNFGSYTPSLYFCSLPSSFRPRQLRWPSSSAPISFSSFIGAALAISWRTTRAVAGVPSQPNVFYIAQVNGGVWKTDDYGRTWTPIFDNQPTGSVGCIAVAAADANVIYVAVVKDCQRPDLSVGDGIYKSVDAGKTWTHLGLPRASRFRR